MVEYRRLAEEWGIKLDNPKSITMGMWIGGDRDGNPFVTAETLKLSATLQSEVILMLDGFTGIIADVSFHLAQPVTEEFQLHVVYVVILGHLEDGVFGQNGLVRGCHRTSLYFQARHCFSPAMKVSFGRLRPMNTILLDGVSWGSHFLPTSAPIIMWTPIEDRKSVV